VASVHDAQVTTPAAGAHAEPEVLVPHQSAITSFATSRLADPLPMGTDRALNRQIWRLAAMLPGGLAHEYAFGCECGCSQVVRRSAAEYDRDGGAWLEGHGASLP
jgi:hypothetical protein